MTPRGQGGKEERVVGAAKALEDNFSETERTTTAGLRARTGLGGIRYESDVDVAQRISAWRNKKQGADHSDSFSLSEDTVSSPSYLRFESNNLGRFAARDGMLGGLAFKFITFMMAMPMAVVAIFVKEVERIRDFCNSTAYMAAQSFVLFCFSQLMP